MITVNPFFEDIKKVHHYYPATIKELANGQFKVLGLYHASLQEAKDAVDKSFKVISQSIKKAA